MKTKQTLIQNWLLCAALLAGVHQAAAVQQIPDAGWSGMWSGGIMVTDQTLANPVYSIPVQLNLCVTNGVISGSFSMLNEPCCWSCSVVCEICGYLGIAGPVHGTASGTTMSVTSANVMMVMDDCGAPPPFPVSDTPGYRGTLTGGTITGYYDSGASEIPLQLFKSDGCASCTNICPITLNPTNADYDEFGTGYTDGSVSVTMECDSGYPYPWTAVSDSTDWLKVTSPASGESVTGNGTVTYSVAVNNCVNDRVGHLCIGGQTFTVSQSEGLCSLSVTPTNAAATYGFAAKTNNVVKVKASCVDCAWTASSGVDWITITIGSGLGSTNMTYNVAENDDTRQRSGTLMFGGTSITPLPFTVTQTGATPTGVKAVAGNAQITLRWQYPGNAQSYNVKRSTTKGGPYTPIASPTTMNYTDTDVANRTKYYYVVSAVDAFGEGPNSSEVKATAMSTVPAAPTDLAAVGGTGQVALNWTEAVGATNYNVKRATSSGGETTIGSTTDTNYTDTGLANGTLYYYMVSAVDAVGEGTNSIEMKATTTPAPTSDATICAGSTLHLFANITADSYAWTGPNSFTSTAQNPTIPTATTAAAGTYNLTVTIGGCASAPGSVSATVNPSPTITLGPNPSVCSGATNTTLSYSAATGSPDKYSIAFGATATAQGFVDVPLTALPNPSPIVVTVPPAAVAGTYTGTLTVTNTATGCVGASYPISVTIYQGPASPFLQVAFYGDIVNHCSSCTYSCPAGWSNLFVSGYVGTAWRPSYTGSSLVTNYVTANGTITITLTAIACGDANNWFEAGKGINSTLGFPHNLMGVLESNHATSSIQMVIGGLVSGVAYQINVVGNSYPPTVWQSNIYDLTGGGADACPTSSPVIRTGGWGDNLFNVTAQNGQVVLQFQGTDGIAGFTITQLSGVAPPAPTGLAAVVANGQITLNWTACGCATSYKVYRGPTPASAGMFLIGSSTTTSYTDTAPVAGYINWYVVTAVDTGGESAPSNVASGETAPGVPAGLAATAGTGRATLTWTASADAASYNVKRSTISGSEATITNLAATSYTDAGLVNGTTYYYEVTAVNSGGQESAHSNEAHATPALPPAPLLGGITFAPGNGFTFSFTNVPSAGFIVYASTNIALPFSNWTILGSPSETAEGSYSQYQFTDPQATNRSAVPRLFYRISIPRP